MTWIRGFLIVLFGGLPATALLWLALIPLVAAFSIFPEQPLSAAQFMVWFVLAAIGTLALWASAFRPTSLALAAGLVAGLLAISPFASLTVRDWFDGQTNNVNTINVAIAGPTIVAIFLVFSFFSEATNRKAIVRRVSQLLGKQER